MAKGKWQVFSNTINGYTKYRVGRKLREDEPLHSGNVEYLDGFVESKDRAQMFVDKFNEDCPILIDGKCNPDCAILKGSCSMPCLYRCEDEKA